MLDENNNAFSNEGFAYLAEEVKEEYNSLLPRLAAICIALVFFIFGLMFLLQFLVNVIPI